MCLLFSTAHILEMIFLEVVGLATFTWDTQRNPKENRDDHLIALMSMVGREKQGQGQSCDFFFWTWSYSQTCMENLTVGACLQTQEFLLCVTMLPLEYGAEVSLCIYIGKKMTFYPCSTIK